MAQRSHPFPFRTRKLSSVAMMILGWRRPGKLIQCRHLYSSLAQSVEHSAVNRVVACSSQAGGAKKSAKQLFGTLFFIILNSDSFLLFFTKCENAGIKSFFCFPEKKQNCEVADMTDTHRMFRRQRCILMKYTYRPIQ